MIKTVMTIFISCGLLAVIYVAILLLASNDELRHNKRSKEK